MTSPARTQQDSHDHRWVVDLSTKRIARAHCVVCAAAADAQAAEDERSTLMDVMKEVREALEESAATIEPAEADMRNLAIEPGEHLPPPAPKASHGKTKAPASAEVHPSMKDLGREHRGY